MGVLVELLTTQDLLVSYGSIKQSLKKSSISHNSKLETSIIVKFYKMSLLICFICIPFHRFPFTDHAKRAASR